MFNFRRKLSMALSPPLKQKLIQKLEKQEDRINHLYYDSKGYLTIGVGHLITGGSRGVQSLPLYTIKHNKPDRLATNAEKIAEYNNLIGRFKKNHSAKSYKKYTNLIMLETDISKQRDKHIDNFYRELCKEYKVSNNYYKNFDQFPDKAKIALFDMIFNLGSSRLRKQYIRFNSAVRKGDWTTASSESNRLGIAPQRNRYVKDLLLAAHTLKEKIDASIPNLSP